MARTLEEVDAALASLEARVNVLDGVSLPETETSAVDGLLKRIAGVKTTLSQVALSFEAELNKLAAAVKALDARLNQHLTKPA